MKQASSNRFMGPGAGNTQRFQERESLANLAFSQVGLSKKRDSTAMSKAMPFAGMIRQSAQRFGASLVGGGSPSPPN